MRLKRGLVGALVTAIALVVPATAAHASPVNAVQVTILWPTCVTVVGTTACIPP